MNKKAKLTSVAVTSTLLIVTLVGSAQAKPNFKPHFNRYSGQDRFQTSTAIAQEEIQGQQMQNVVLASAYSFPDALSASTLATKLNASIILVGTDVNDSEASLNFVKKNLKAGGNVTIIGGVGIINEKVEKWLHKAGYHVTRMGGSDRFDTNSIIVNNLNVSPGTPVIVVSGNEFPDALGVASLAASKGWPILLSSPTKLPDNVKDFISKDQPSNIYIVGGKAVINDSLQTTLQSLAPSAQIQRFGGQDRFETLSQILTKFYPNPTQIYLANGYDYADALSGSTLAAQNNAPILLIDPKSRQLPPSIKDYLITIRNTGSNPQINVLGGSVGVPDWAVNLVSEIFGDSTTSSGVIPVTVSNPSTTGITVGLNPAINGLTVNNFTLLNSSGNSIALTGATTFNGGATYTVNVPLSAGQTYTLRVNYNGNSVGTAQTFTVPYVTSNQTVTVSNPTTTGFTVGLSSSLNGLTASNFTLKNSYGYTVPITGLTTLNGGAAYTVSAALSAGQTYTLTANYAGYTLGTAQTFTVPYVTSNQTVTISNPTTSGFTVGLSSSLNGLTTSNFTLKNSYGYTVPITGVTTLNGGATYTVSAALTVGQTYTLTANYAGYNLGTAQSFTVPYTNVSSETLTVSTPSSTGFTVGLSSALNGLTINNFTLLNSAGYSIPITGVTTLNGGATYTVSAALTAGQTYTLTANYAGYALGTAQSFAVPYTNVNSETLTVSTPSTTGFTVGLSSALNGLTINNFTLLNSAGYSIPITGVTTLNGGATYTISAALSAGQTYTLTANYAGYTMGTAQSFTVPYNTSNLTYTVNNISTTGFKVRLSTALNGLTSSNFTLLDSSGNRIAFSSVATSDGGTTYTISAVLNAGQTYTLTANYNGYAFGTSQNFVVPSV